MTRVSRGRNPPTRGAGQDCEKGGGGLFRTKDIALVQAIRSDDCNRGLVSKTLLEQVAVDRRAYSSLEDWADYPERRLG